MTIDVPATGLSASSMGHDPLFEVVCIPIGVYRDQAYESLPADDEAAKIEKLLAPFGGSASSWAHQAPEGRTLSAVTERLSRWSTLEARRSPSSILFWVGHGAGHPDGTVSGAMLAVHDSSASSNLGGISPETLAAHILEEWANCRFHLPGAFAIVVIEACGAKRFIRLLHSKLAALAEPPARLAVIGVGPDHGAAALGEFGRILRYVLHEVYTDNDTTIALDDLVMHIKRRLLHGDAQELDLHLAASIPRPRLLPDGITATIEVYRELQQFVATLPDDQRNHFVTKAQAAEQSEPAWYFVGRDNERAATAAWLRRHEHGMLVITGPAGSGKSAFLGHVLVHTTPPLRDLLIRARQLLPGPEGEFSSEMRFDAVVHLTGMTTAALISRLAAELRLQLPSTGASTGADIDELVQAVIDTEQPIAVMLDALDEADEPVTIAGSVLRRLAALHQVQLVVGTRASLNEGPDLPDPGDEGLLEALGHDATVLRLTPDPEAVNRFVQLRLTAARAHGRIAADDETIARIAQRVQSQNRQFLYASLAVHEIIAAPALLTVRHRDDLFNLLSHDHRTLFAAAVDRLSRERPSARPILEALALARGRGLPQHDGIWATMATALNNDVPITEVDIDHLRSAAAPYVMMDSEHGQTVYRLAHRTFTEHFQSGLNASLP
ncbi:ATP-binding protein [Nonomuraea wenchangensis]